MTRHVSLFVFFTPLFYLFTQRGEFQVLPFFFGWEGGQSSAHLSNLILQFIIIIIIIIILLFQVGSLIIFKILG